jgi:hypothetical protein
VGGGGGGGIMMMTTINCVYKTKRPKGYCVRNGNKSAVKELAFFREQNK